MKKIILLIVIFTFILSNSIIALENNDNDLYLSDDDKIAVETTLPEDDILGTMTLVQDDTVKIAEEPVSDTGDIYHLLILDRINCAPNSDISGIENITVLYKFLHGKDGYLIAVYKSSGGGPVLPNGSSVVLNLAVIRKNTMKEFIQSGAFRIYVSKQEIISGLLELF